MPQDMTDEAICRALATAMGWTQQTESVWRKPERSYVRVYAAGDEPTTVQMLQLGDHFWNPLKSLDDVAEVEAEIARRGLGMQYARLLREAVTIRSGAASMSSDFSLATALADVRCLAALKTLTEAKGADDAD